MDDIEKAQRVRKFASFSGSISFNAIWRYDIYMNFACVCFLLKLFFLTHNFTAREINFINNF